MRRLLSAALLALALAAQAQTTLPAVPLPPEIDRVLRDYERAWSAKDTAALAALFAPGGLALPNGSLPARGAAQIQAAYAQGAGSPLVLRALAFSMAGGLAYVVGGFAGAPNEADAGKFVLVLERGADGRWLIAADIDNMNARPRRPPAG